MVGNNDGVIGQAHGLALKKSSSPGSDSLDVNNGGMQP